MSAGWLEARAAAGDWPALAPARVPLSSAAGLVLAEDLVARTDLPSYWSSAMDGWAVAGPPPWAVVGQVLAGQQGRPRLSTGEAVRVATGSHLPQGVTEVVRREHGAETARAGSAGATIGPAGVLGHLAPGPGWRPASGRDVRPVGTEATRGEVVAAKGSLVGPALIGLAAAAGADDMLVQARPTFDLVVMGDELDRSGLVRPGRVRDVLGPMLPPWIEALGGSVRGVEFRGDSAADLEAAVRGSLADVLVTTGSTALGPRDNLHTVLERLGAQLVVDGVRVRPGHPMVLARLCDGRPLVGLPGNPLGAVAAVVTLLTPLLAAMRARPATGVGGVWLEQDLAGHQCDVRLVPLRQGRPVGHVGAAMLRGLARADTIAVVPPGGATAGQLVDCLDLVP